MKVLICLLILPLTSFAKEASYAFLPYVNYDTTQSWSYGIAFEKEAEILNADSYLLDTEFTQAGQWRLTVDYQTFFTPDWRISLRNDYTSFYDPFYGFGLSTEPGNLKKIKQHQWHFQTLLFHQFSNYFSIGPFVELRKRKEFPERQVDHQRYFPDESTLSIGGSLLYDTRDSKANPSRGVQHELYFSIVPDRINNLEGKSTFSRFKLDLRKYTPFIETVLATRFAVGTTIGDPTYLYKYRLGGANFLRGYQTNRFIGDKFMAAQIEDRINLYKNYVAGTISYEVGSVTPNLIDKRRSSYGVGLRVAMPPDWSNMLVLNFGFGDDQKNIIMDFNENF